MDDEERMRLMSRSVHKKIEYTDSKGIKHTGYAKSRVQEKITAKLICNPRQIVLGDMAEGVKRMKLFDKFEAISFYEENLIFITNDGYLYYIYDRKYNRWRKHRNAGNDCLTVCNYALR